MKCLSLWQPWATAIALRLKKIETRSWSTEYTGPIAVHAAKRQITKDDMAYLDGEPCWEEFLQRLGAEPMPYGAIVAIATLRGCFHTGDLLSVDLISAREAFWGNYDSGRYGWSLGDVHGLAVPIPFHGAQGLFEIPDDLIPRVTT